MYELQRKAFQSGIEDAHGNAVDGWAAPVPLSVLAIAPGAMDEPGDPNRDLSMVLYTLYCPAGTVVGERDLVVLDAVDYAVDGRPQDFTRGPWANPIAGVVIYLKRVEG